MLSTTALMFGRELLMFVTLVGLGSGVTRLLPQDLDGTTRAMLCPALGIAVGGSAFTTLIWFFPASRTDWLVPVLVVASASCFWIFHRRRAAETIGREKQPASACRRRAVLLAALEIAFVCVAIAGPITYTFVVRNSVGPVGYDVGDSQGYVATIDGMGRQSIRTAMDLEGSATYNQNMVQKYWSDYSGGVQELDITPLTSNLGALVGLTGTAEQSPFLIACMVAGGLGISGVVRALAKRRRWVAPIAGAFFSGAFFIQLFFDGSEGALLGLAVLCPMLLVLWRTMKDPRASNIALSGLMGAALVEMYPLFVPAIGIVVATALFVLGIRSMVDRTWRTKLARGLLQVVEVTVLIGAFNVVAMDRSLRYWLRVLEGKYTSNGLPHYNFLTPRWLPSWLLQVREFYAIGTHQPIFSTAIFDVALPIVVILVIAVALRRHPMAWIFGGGILACFAIGTYERTSNTCSYCEDRNLLPVVPLALVLIGVGFTMLLASQSRRIRAVTALVGVGVIVGAIHTSYSSLMRFRDAAYYLDRAARVGVAQVPTNKVVELEGFGEGPVPITEQGLIYMLAEERDWGKVSLPDDYNEGGSLIYLGGGGFPLDSPQFIPSYTYVLTRLPDVATHRQTIWRVGGIALQRRTGRFDVTPDYGLSIPYLRLNPTGAAYGSYYTVEPIKFIVTGKSTKPVYVNVQVVHALATPPKITTPGAPLARIQKNGITTWVCVEAVGTSPIRTAYIQYEPSTVVQLKSMAATTTPCKG